MLEDKVNTKWKTETNAIYERVYGIFSKINPNKNKLNKEIFGLLSDTLYKLLDASEEFDRIYRLQYKYTIGFKDK